MFKPELEKCIWCESMILTDIDGGSYASLNINCSMCGTRNAVTLELHYICDACSLRDQARAILTDEDYEKQFNETKQWFLERTQKGRKWLDFRHKRLKKIYE